MRTRTLTSGLMTMLTLLSLGCHSTSQTAFRPGSALETLKLTCQAVSPTTFECPKETMRAIGHALIDAEADLAKGGLDVRACRASLDDCNYKLEAWYRKWYITVPLGILLGVGVGFGAAVGAGL